LKKELKHIKGVFKMITDALFKEIETELDRKLTRTEIKVFSYIYDEGRKSGKEEQKDFILDLIANRS
jgi:hypothetical protein